MKSDVRTSKNESGFQVSRMVSVKQPLFHHFRLVSLVLLFFNQYFWYYWLVMFSPNHESFNFKLYKESALLLFFSDP